MDKTQSIGGTWVDPRFVGDRLYDGKLAKSVLSDNQEANAQGQICVRTDTITNA